MASDNYDSGFDLVLSSRERAELLNYYNETCLDDWKQNYESNGEDDLWYDIQIGERMFDLNVWLDDITGKLSCTVYECDWDGKQNNWKTNCRHSWSLTEEA